MSPKPRKPRSPVGKPLAQMTKAELIQRIAELESRQAAGGAALAGERLRLENGVQQAELAKQNQELQESQRLLEESRDRYSDLYDFAPVGLLTLDARGTIREINLTACALLGSERSRLLHQPFHTHVTAEDRSKLRPHLQPREQPGARVETELQLVWKGRPTIVLNVQSVLIGDDENGDLRCRAALTDVTAHRRAEAELREAKERFEVAVAGSADGLWDWDLTTDTVFYSPRFKELLGFTPTDRRFPDVFASFKTRLHPEDVAPTEDAIARAVRDGVPYRATYRLKTADGDWRWFEARGATLRDAHGAATRMAGSITDITERRQHDEALRASELRFRHLVESTRMIAWERPVKGKEFTYVSPWAREALGHPLADWTKPGFFHNKVVHAGDRKMLAKAVQAALARDEDFELEYRLMTADGRTLWFRDIVHVVRGLKGPEVLKGFLIDITARKHAEAALRLSEERFRKMAGAINQVFWMTTVDKNEMLYVSPAYERIWGRTCGSLYAAPRTWLNAVHPDDRAGLLEAATAQQAAGTYDVEYRIIRPDGTERWIRDRAFPIGDGAGNVHGIAGVAEDTTEHRRLRSELIKISDDVQQRIGQDLHDEICQQLAGITFRLECLQGDIEEGTATHRGIGEICGLLRGATVAARTMAHTLAPVSVEPGGLTDALEKLAERSASLFRIRVDFICAQAVTVADALAAGHLYRIAQEAIANARKHGQARRIRLTLAATPGGGSLTVADNGRGCALPVPNNGGMGLRIMRSRAGLIGATLHLEPAPDGGLAIRCDFRSPTQPQKP